MRTLILTQHFAPEVTAGSFRLQVFSRALAARGHDVEVICPVPNHPEGIVASGYRGRALIRSRVGEIAVKRTWVYVRPKRTFATRLGYYGSFAAAGTLLGAAARRPDVVLASSPPLPVGAAGALVAMRHRVPFVFDVRDLWPESAVTLGELTNPRAIALAERLERWLYARAAAIVTVNGAFRHHIEERSGAPEKVTLIPNGTTREWMEAGELEVSREAVDLPERVFVWAYAGNIGLAHDLETAVRAAELLGEGFMLLIIGQGPGRKHVERAARALPADRVVLRSLMPAAQAARQLRAADALLVSERQEKTVSSKLYDYRAVGRPVIAAAQGELERLIEERGIALRVPVADAAAMASAVRRMRDDAELRDELVTAGRAFAAEHLREQQAERLADVLERVGMTPA